LKPRAFLWLCGAAALVVVLAWLASQREHGAAAPDVPASPIAAAGSGPSAHSPDPAAAPPALPDSLRGSEPDGTYTLDERGRLLPSPDVLRRFDYHLAGSGEEPLAAAIARIEAEIAATLSPEAAADARALLAGYLAYRDAARALHAEGLDPADLDTRMQRLRELRREHFGAETSALLFAEDETFARYALERVRIARDPDLEAAERAARLEALEAELPEAMRAQRERARLPSDLAREEEALRASGAGDAAIRELREERVGPEAALRLESLDATRRAWAERMTAYRQERDRLLADPDRASPEALATLRALHFTPAEIPRVEGLDRIDGVAPSS